jgi:hypothetical protein
MVIAELDIRRLRLRVPFEDQPPLIVHSDAPETGEIAGQLLEVIRRGCAKVVDVSGGVQHVEFADRSAPNVYRKMPDAGRCVPMEEVGCGLVPEARDHGP